MTVIRDDDEDHEKPKFIPTLSASSSIDIPRFDTGEGSHPQCCRCFSRGVELIRGLARTIVTYKHFDNCLLVLIIANTIILITQDYRQGRGGWAERLQNKTEYVFVICFSMEMVLKMAAYGICFPEDSYFRDSWNWLDFIVVVTGLESFTSDDGNLTFLRASRVLRPLRTLEKLPMMRTLVRSVFLSISRLVNVAAMSLFLLVLFSILGLNLWGGLMHRRCRLTPAPLQFVAHKKDCVPPGHTFCFSQPSFLGENTDIFDVWCKNDPVCLERIQKGGNHVTWPFDPNQERLCGGRYECEFIIGPMQAEWFPLAPNATDFEMVDIEQKANHGMNELWRLAARNAKLGARGAGDDDFTFWDLANVSPDSWDLHKMKHSSHNLHELHQRHQLHQLHENEDGDGPFPWDDTLAIFAAEEENWPEDEEEYWAGHYDPFPLGPDGGGGEPFPPGPDGGGGEPFPPGPDGGDDDPFPPGPDGGNDEPASDYPDGQPLPPPYPDVPNGEGIGLWKTACGSLVLSDREHGPRARMLREIGGRVSKTLEIYDENDLNSENFNYGFTRYDNIGLSFLAVFQVITLEGWTDILYMVQDAYNDVGAFFYFFCLILIGSFFLLNITLAIVWDAFKSFTEKSKDEERNRIHPEEIHDCGCGNAKAQRHGAKKATKFRRFFIALSTNEAVSGVVMLTILLNVIMLSLTSFPSPEKWLRDFLEEANVFFAIVFVIECLVQHIALKPYHYWTQTDTAFDGIVVTLSIVELCIEGNSIMTAFRSFRLLRIFKLAKKWYSFRMLLKTIARTVLSLGSFGLLLILVIIVFALAGQSFFALMLMFDDKGRALTECQGEKWFRDEKCQKELCPMGYSVIPDCVPRAHYDSFLWAFVTIFQILSLENWNSVMYDGMIVIGWTSSIFYIVTITTGSFVILNLFVAIIMANFDEESTKIRAIEQSDRAASIRQKALRKIHDAEKKLIIGNHELSTWHTSLARATSVVYGPHSANDVRRQISEYFMGFRGEESPAPSEGGRDEKNARRTLESLSSIDYPHSRIDDREGSNLLTLEAMPPPESETLESGGSLSQTPKMKDNMTVALFCKDGPLEYVILNNDAQKEGGELRRQHSFIHDDDGEYNRERTKGAEPPPVVPETQSKEDNDDPTTTSHIISSMIGPKKKEEAKKKEGNDGTMEDESQKEGREEHQLKEEEHSFFHHKSESTTEERKGKDVSYVRIENVPVEGERIEKELSLRTMEEPVNLREEKKKKPKKPPGPFKRFRRCMVKLSGHKYFDQCVFYVIMACCISIVFEDPLDNPESTRACILLYWEWAFTIFFTIEMIIKITGFGVCQYFRSPWNLIDALIVVASIIDIIPNDSDELFKKLKLFRVLRAFRPVRMINHNANLKIVVNTLFYSMPQLCNLLLVSILFFFIFGLVALNFFRGSYYACLDIDNEPASFQEFPNTGAPICLDSHIGDFRVGIPGVCDEWLPYPEYEDYMRNTDDTPICVVHCDLAEHVEEKPPSICQNVPWGYNFMTCHECQETLCPNRTEGERATCKVDCLDRNSLYCLKENKHDPVCISECVATCLCPACEGQIHDAGWCVEQGYKWVKMNQNFDTIGSSVMTLFEISTTESWVDVMYTAVDARGPHKLPHRDENKYWSLFFIVFIIFGSFFILNLCVGVIIENFNRLKLNNGGDHLLMTPAQKKWVESQEAFFAKTAFFTKLAALDVKNMHPFRKRLFILVRSPTFDYVMVFCILVNALMMALPTFPEHDETLHYVIILVNFGFGVIFNLEMIAKLIALRWLYFEKKWNRFDFVLIIASDISFILEIIIATRLRRVMALVRLFRIARLIRLIRFLKGLNGLFTALFLSLPKLANVGAILFLLLFLYALIGVSLFGKMRTFDPVNDQANFRDFWRAFITLIRCMTGEGWNNIMHAYGKDKYFFESILELKCEGMVIINKEDYDAYENLGQIENPIECGNQVISFLYFGSFTLAVTFVIFNLFIAVIFEGFDDSRKAADRGNEVITTCLDTWKRYDREYVLKLQVETAFKYINEVLDILGKNRPISNDPRDAAILHPSWNNIQHARILQIRVTRDNEVFFSSAVLAVLRLTVVGDDGEILSQLEAMERGEVEKPKKLIKKEKKFNHSLRGQEGRSLEETLAAMRIQRRIKLVLAYRKAKREKEKRQSESARQARRKLFFSAQGINPHMPRLTPRDR